jgi:hypothetical protein
MSHNAPNVAPSQIRDKAKTFLMILLAADLAFIMLDVLVKIFGPVDTNLVFLETDRGYAEIFQYVKEYWVVILLGALLWRFRKRIYLVWVVLYTYFLVDDSFQIHEHGGRLIAGHLGSGKILALRTQDIGEITIYICIALITIALLLIYYPRSKDDEKIATKDLLVLTVVFVVFGVGFDMLDIAFEKIYYLCKIMELAEDGGEMIAMSLVCWYAYNLVLNEGLPNLQIWPKVKALVSPEKFG